MSKRPFGGIITPLATPLDSEGAILVKDLERLVENQLAAGVHGLFALGSTGEAIYLSDKQRIEVVETVTGVASGSVPIFIGAVEASTNRVIEQMRQMERFSPAAFVVTAPFYAVTGTRETADHFRYVSAHSVAPILLYDIPGNVGYSIEVKIMKELFEEGVVIGFKDSSGNLERFLALVAEMGDQRSTHLFSGAGDVADQILSAGADGVVAGIANICAAELVSLYNAHRNHASSEVARFQEIATLLSQIYGIGQKYGLGRHASELGALKVVMVRQGLFQHEYLSKPLAPYPAGARVELHALIERMGY